MTGTDLCVNKPNQSLSYLNHLVHWNIVILVLFYVCVCEDWNLIFRDGHFFRMLESRMQRRMCGPNKKEVTRG